MKSSCQFFAHASGTSFQVMYQVMNDVRARDGGRLVIYN